MTVTVSATAAALGLEAARWVGFALVAPGWTSVPMPAAVRGAWVVAVGVMVVPAVTLPAGGLPASWAGWGTAAVEQALVGMVMGLVCAAALSAFPAAAELLQNVMGLALFTPAEPGLTAANSGLPLFWTLLGAEAFFAGHGLTWLILAFRASFQAVPLLGVHWALPWWRVAAGLGQLVLSTALQLAGPGLAMALGLYLVAGFLARAFPTLNVYPTVLPAMVLAVLAVVTAGLLPEANWSAHLWRHAERTLGRLLTAWHNG